MLVALIDADLTSVEERLSAFDAACELAGIGVRGREEPVAVFVPRRNIETWISYLAGEDVDEFTSYPKLRRARECAESVRALKSMCDADTLREPSPPSLQAACLEYGTRIRLVDEMTPEGSG